MAGRVCPCEDNLQERSGTKDESFFENECEYNCGCNKEVKQ